MKSTDTRKLALRTVIEAMELEDAITDKELHQRMKLEGCEEDLTYRKITYAHDAVKPTLARQLRFKNIKRNKANDVVSYEVVVTEEEQTTVFINRSGKQLREKRVIAEALWGWLFDFSDNFETRFGDESSGVRQRLERKRNVLRRTNGIRIAIDAGTTTRAVVRSLLKRNHIPFKMALEDGSILIVPSFLTNSIPISEEIGVSGHQGLSCTIVGGNERVGRRSICGELSQLWLGICQSAGHLVGVDIAIVGMTGYRQDFHGLPGAGCDDPNESALKAKFLELGAHGLRILVADSTKLTNGEFHSCFSSIAYPAVDLVVIDQGNEKSAADVENMVKALNNEKVGVLLAKLP